MRPISMPFAVAAISATIAFTAAVAPAAAATNRAVYASLNSYATQYEPGTIVVKTSERKLYLIQNDGQTLVYPIAVGKPGKTWTGTAQIEGKFVRPAWSPPEEIRRDKPSIPDVIPGGSPENPMGAAAMTLSGGGQYAIHGTNNPRSIGTFASYGCIRMLNQDIVDLYSRVDVGTTVVVLR